MLPILLGVNILIFGTVNITENMVELFSVIYSKKKFNPCDESKQFSKFVSILIIVNCLRTQWMDVGFSSTLTEFYHTNILISYKGIYHTDMFKKQQQNSQVLSKSITNLLSKQIIWYTWLCFISNKVRLFIKTRILIKLLNISNLLSSCCIF